MKKSSLVKKTIQKASKPTQKELSKRVVQRLEKNRRETLRSHTKIQIKPVVNNPKPAPVIEPPETFLRDPKSYNKIQELPVYEPTNEEFKQPLLLIRKLMDLGYDKYGCIKIITPKSWNPEFAFNRPDKKLTTRKQNLRDLTKGKPFEQNIEAYTLEEFEEMADEFKAKHKHKSSFKFSNQYRANEFDFWSLVEDPQFTKKKVTVEYAADLPTRRYGSAFPTVHGAKVTDTLNAKNEKTHPFNLNNINHAKDSLFQIITTKSENISGITSPWIYFGMLFASFCWHVEDLYMYSINYMHKGAPKTWYCIPPDYKEQFDKIIHEKYADLFNKQPGLMHNIVLALNPLELVEQNIPVYRTEQGPRDFIVTFPKAYHAGFSHGFNISEAVNIATYDWIEYAEMAVEDYRREGNFKKVSFPYEWLVVENVRKMQDIELTKEAKTQLAKDFEEIKQIELEKRDSLRNRYNKVIIRQFDDKLNRYDSHECMQCKNYTYLSFATCIVCCRKSCVNHNTVCNCVGSTIILNVRFTDEELKNLSKGLKSFLSNKKGKK